MTRVLPPSIVGGEQDVNPYPLDVDRARELLASAGYANGLELKLLYRNADEGSRRAFAAVQQDLKEIGITVTGVPASEADFSTRYLHVPTAAGAGLGTWP